MACGAKTQSLLSGSFTIVVIEHTRGVKILMRPCASPHAPVVGHCGTHIRLDVRHHRSRKHLPIVALRRAAYPQRFGISRHRRHLSASIAFVVLRCPSGAHFEASAL